jgi:hypothetical protein
MDLPEVVQEALGDESVAARVELGGEDLVVVTPSRTLVYRGEGLLSDESVTELPHDAERIEVKEGRRKSTVYLDYGLDGERDVGLPSDRLAAALHPILAGVLNAAGVTEPGETVKETFLLNELTVVVTSARLVRHVGEVVWDEEYEEYHYADVTDLSFEEGSVATSVVVRHDGAQERFKIPNDRARALRECLTDAVLAYHDLDSLEALRERARATERAEATDESAAPATGPDERDVDRLDFGDGPDPLDADPEPPDAAEVARTAPRDGPADGDGDDGFREAGFEPAGPVDGDDDGDRLAAEVAALREQVERQNELLAAHGERLDEQGELFQALVEELRRGR